MPSSDAAPSRDHKRKAHLAGGLAAGFASTALLYPLEVVRTRFQADFRYRSTLQAVRQMWLSGGARELYRGFLPGIAGSTLAWGQFFWLYGSMKHVLQANREERLSPLHHLASSFTAGVIVQLTLCPLWVVKNNQQLGNFPSFYAGARQLWAAEGLRGFYRGLTPGIFSSIQGGVQFLVYEECRAAALKSRRGGNRVGANRGEGYLPVHVTMGCTVASKTVALLATSPIEVVKVRMRHVGAGVHYASVLDSVRTIARHEGLGGFYKGLHTNLIRLLPAQCTTFVTYEYVKEKVLRHLN